MTGQPPDIRGRYAAGLKLGKLHDRGELWGYLLVRPETITWHRPLRAVSEPAIVEETYRLSPPADEDIDWADETGWSDALIKGNELAEEISRLERGQLLLTGRTLSIEWLDDEESIAIETRFFRRTR